MLEIKVEKINESSCKITMQINKGDEIIKYTSKEDVTITINGMVKEYNL